MTDRVLTAIVECGLRFILGWLLAVAFFAFIDLEVDIELINLLCLVGGSVYATLMAIEDITGKKLI